MKSGTSALATYLGQHPEIGGAHEKELHFFNRVRAAQPQSYAEYHSRFVFRPGAKTYGEVTPAYMYEPDTMARIWRYNRSMKIICVLRNPIERAYSHWAMSVQMGWEINGFEDAIRMEMKRHRDCAPNRDIKRAYIDRGYYSEQVRRIWTLFPPHQVKILRMEWLKKRPQEVMSEVFSFLGVSPRLVKSEIVNQGSYTEAMSAKSKSMLREIYINEIREIERMLSWNCSNWLV
jgi:hypothetical protein